MKKLTLVIRGSDKKRVQHVIVYSRKELEKLIELYKDKLLIMFEGHLKEFSIWSSEGWVFENKKSKNKIITIGCIGVKKVYLNLSKEEAIQRFISSLEIPYSEYEEYYKDTYEEIEFNDEL
jgi:hypothetical protein